MRANGNYSRRELLGGIIAAGAVQGLGGCRLAGHADAFDENPKGEGLKNGVAGVLDKAQQEWLMETGKAAKRPFLVGVHHPIAELKIGDSPLVMALVKLPCFAGYVHGHDHRWYAKWYRSDWKSRRIRRSVCLPSTGWWGDIGFALLRSHPDHAVMTLVQNDFFFPKPLEAGERRPKEWDDVLNAHRNATCEFRF